MNTKNILKEMKPEEKVLLLQAKNHWALNGVERLDIPSVILTDGPNGVRMMTSDGGTELSTAIPTESILSASWDVELVKKLGKMMAEECQYYHIGILLGPGVNAKRSPLAGRNFEYYSEDPYLSGKLAIAMIEGIQEEGIGTSLKHFVANDQETRRFTMNATVDERTLREILLKPFEMAIKEAKPWTIMAAYPRLRGQYLCENTYVLKNILRDEYQYEGVVLSDWSAVVNKVASHKNGLDLETGSYARMQEMLNALEEQTLTAEEVDEHAFRVLQLIQKVVSGRKAVSVDWNAHHELAREAARRSIVLLKNEGDILPLSEKMNVAVIGKFAKEPHFKGGGSSGTNPQKLDRAYDFICHYAKAEYAAGYETEEVQDELIDEACCVAKGKDAVVVFIGTTDAIESEGSDRVNMLLPESHIALVNKLFKCNENLIVVNSSGAPVELRQIEASTKGILHMGLAGEGGGAAIADILFGMVNPSGKLTETYPICLENTPAFPYFPGYNDEVDYREGLMIGYRYYDTKKIPVQFPFGYGLSYTRFEYSNLSLSTECLKNGEKLQVSVDIKNIGERYGQEVVQFYVSDEKSYLIRPDKELKGFAKVTLNPGETKTVTVELDESAFSYYVPHLKRFAVESGKFRIFAASSAADIRLIKEVLFESTDEVRLPLTVKNTIGEFYADNRYHKVTKQVLDFLQIDEKDPGFLIAAGITLESLPQFLYYLSIPEEQGEKLVECIIKQNPLS